MCRQIFTNCKIGGTQREAKKDQTTAALPAVPSKKNRAWKTSQQQNTSSDVFASSHLFIVFNYCPLPGVWIAFTSYNFSGWYFGSPL